MYSRCGELDDARQVFEEKRDRGICDIVSWNSIVAGYMQSRDAKNAVELFRRMASDLEIRPELVGWVAGEGNAGEGWVVGEDTSQRSWR
ncbi:hypothetical protein V6N13_025061 [Hibiscus sabdariffa]